MDLLREDLGLTGTKEAAAPGVRGCTILVDGESRFRPMRTGSSRRVDND